MAARGSQVAHGFSVGEVIRRNFGGTVWELAQSDALSIVRGVVDEVLNDDLFSFEFEGRTRLAAHGLTPGAVYYIDPSTPGAVLTPQPVTGQQDPILYVTDADNVVIFESQGGATVYRRSFVNADLAAGVLTVTHNLNKQYVHLEIYDNTNTQVALSTLTAVVATSVNVLSPDFTALGALVGTWNLIVSG